MTIERMHIRNFKGIRDLEISFGDVTRISGMNGTGKTTIPDAFSWVLFNRDSRGNTPGSFDFREKPLDAAGDEIHNLDTEVELDCRIDGQRFNLRRVQRENWVKKRGATEAVFQGNVSTYWVNDVETKLSDFKARIAQIADEDVFRLIGSLSAFNELDWKKRREQLIALSGMDVDAHLLQQERYRPLADECAERGVNVSDLRKIVTDQRKRTNAELQMIPVRIDEARKSMPDLKPDAEREARYIVDDCEKDIAQINIYIAEAKAQVAPADGKSIFALEQELLGVQREMRSIHNAEREKAEAARSIASDKHRFAAEALAEQDRRIARAQKELEETTATRDQLRRAHIAEQEKPFTPPHIDGICPTCQQTIPEDMIAKTIEAARKAFEDTKMVTLDDIKRRGIRANEDIATIKTYFESFKQERAALADDVTKAATERDSAYAALQSLPAEPDYASEPRIIELRKQIVELKAQRQESPDEKIAGYEQRKAELTEMMKRNQEVLARVQAAKDTEKRIKELEQQQKDMGVRVSHLEKLLDLLDAFVKDRCNALEDSINDQFPTVRWKLFEILINGGINDVCQAYLPCGDSLVSYGSANTAAQVNADIEIINVLSGHYGVSLPLFADNSERVNVLAPTDSQLIALSVSTDSELQIKTENMKEAV